MVDTLLDIIPVKPCWSNVTSLMQSNVPDVVQIIVGLALWFHEAVAAL